MYLHLDNVYIYIYSGNMNVPSFCQERKANKGPDKDWFVICQGHLLSMFFKMTKMCTILHYRHSILFTCVVLSTFVYCTLISSSICRRPKHVLFIRRKQVFTKKDIIYCHLFKNAFHFEWLLKPYLNIEYHVEVETCFANLMFHKDHYVSIWRSCFLLWDRDRY